MSCHVAVENEVLPTGLGMHTHKDMVKAGRGPLIQKTALKGITGGKRDNMTPLLHYPIRQSEAKEIKNQHTKTIKT